MLPQAQRVRADRDFRQIFRSSRPVRGRFLTLRARPSPSGRTRFGFVVSKKVAKLATDRNLIKRRLRAAVRDLPPANNPTDAVFIAGPAAPQGDFKLLAAEMHQLWKSLQYAPPPHRRY